MWMMETDTLKLKTISFHKSARRCVKRNLFQIFYFPYFSVFPGEEEEYALTSVLWEGKQLAVEEF